MKKALIRIVLSSTLLLTVSCGKNDPEPYSDVFDVYRYKDVGYDDILDKQSEYLIVIGDMQYYNMQSEDVECLRMTMDWIWSQVQAGVSIKGILQTGDITQGNTREQWTIFNNHFLQLRKLIPSVFCTGNHDYASFFGKNITDRSTTRLNDFIKYDNEAATLVETMVNGKQENALLSVEVGGDDLYILSLEFSPRHEVTQWADGIAKQYSDSPMILLTHDYLDASGGLTDNMDEEWLSKHDQGLGLWNKLVEPNDNIRTVLCGHVYFTAKRSSVNSSGNSVTQIMFDPQHQPRGGDGWIQIWEFDPQAAGTVNVSTYNLFRKELKKGASSSFSFIYM